MNMIDDASATMLCRFSAEETIWAAALLLRSWIERYGIPRALYTDWKNVDVRTAAEAERCARQVPLTQFGRMCEKLGIRIIAASSPQAPLHSWHRLRELRLMAYRDAQERPGQHAQAAEQVVVHRAERRVLRAAPHTHLPSGGPDRIYRLSLLILFELPNSFLDE